MKSDRSHRRLVAFRLSKTLARRSARNTEGVRTGSLGTAACFSFYPTKNLGGFGDGGLITTNDGELAAQLNVLRDHGQQPRYYHHFVGLNSRLDALQAAVLSVKLPHLDGWAAARKRHADRYRTEFTTARTERRDVVTPVTTREVPSRVESIHGSREERPARCAAKISGRSQDWIGDLLPGAAPLAEVFRGTWSTKQGSLPVTEQACREVLSLPVYPELTAAEQGTVIDAVTEFCQVKGRAAA